MRVQKDLIKLELSKIVIFVLFLFVSCSQRKTELVQVVIKPFEYTLNISEKSLLLKFEKADIDLMYEDSHSLYNHGVNLYYFGSNHEGLNYYFELYFKDDVLSGIKAVISSNDLSPEDLFSKAQNLISFDVRKVNSEGFEVKTLKFTEPKSEYVFFIKSSNLPSMREWPVD
jgi:hypothetical protein